jgi:hypothetical protein
MEDGRWMRAALPIFHPPSSILYLPSSILASPMIVPSARLLVWFAMIVLPFALLGGVIAAAAVVSLLIIGMFLLAVIVDAFGAGRSLVGIGVELPPVVRLSKDREGKVEVRIRNERKQQRQVRIALPLRNWTSSCPRKPSGRGSHGRARRTNAAVTGSIRLMSKARRRLASGPRAKPCR